MMGSPQSAPRGRSAVRLSRVGVCRADVVEARERGSVVDGAGPRPKLT